MVLAINMSKINRLCSHVKCSNLNIVQNHEAQLLRCEITWTDTLRFKGFASKMDIGMIRKHSEGASYVSVVF
jgi:hypothetical protein